MLYSSTRRKKTKSSATKSTEYLAFHPLQMKELDVPQQVKQCNAGRTDIRPFHFNVSPSFYDQSAY